MPLGAPDGLARRQEVTQAWVLACQPPMSAATPKLALAAGRRPKVVFTEAAGQIAGQVGQVVSLATAIKTSRTKVTGEVVKARLCQSPKGLVYLLTVLARDGKVARLTVDVQSGKLVSGL